jgi:site-specific DNA-cytosine methylase
VADGFPDRLDGGQWLEEPENIPRVTKSQENRASRLKALGNAVVPQVVELIGRAVMAGVTR